MVRRFTTGAAALAIGLCFQACSVRGHGPDRPAPKREAADSPCSVVWSGDEALEAVANAEGALSAEPVKYASLKHESQGSSRPWPTLNTARLATVLNGMGHGIAQRVKLHVISLRRVQGQGQGQGRRLQGNSGAPTYFRHHGLNAQVQFEPWSAVKPQMALFAAGRTAERVGAGDGNEIGLKAGCGHFGDCVTRMTNYQLESVAGSAGKVTSNGIAAFFLKMGGRDAIYRHFRGGPV